MTNLTAIGLAARSQLAASLGGVELTHAQSLVLRFRKEGGTCYLEVDRAIVRETSNNSAQVAGLGSTRGREITYEISGIPRTIPAEVLLAQSTDFLIGGRVSGGKLIREGTVCQLTRFDRASSALAWKLTVTERRGEQDIQLF